MLSEQPPQCFDRGNVAQHRSAAPEDLNLNLSIREELYFPPFSRDSEVNHDGAAHTVEPTRDSPAVELAEKLQELLHGIHGVSSLPLLLQFQVEPLLTAVGSQRHGAIDGEIQPRKATGGER
jgi:hypothetical protein